ncbi:hypothetical protein MBLNU230_g7138t1 [Neophaeotheca triangularis]
MQPHITPGRASVAIIGTSCQLPSGVDNDNALWEFCAGARCSSRPYPSTWFKAESYYHPASQKQGHFNVRAGSFLDRDTSTFDASFFNITAAEAAAMDPQQRLLLECAFTAVENAGLDINELSGRSDIGVFAGGSKSEYASMIDLDLQTASRFSATGNAMTMMANRVSYFFNWRGPSFTVDTACSSSLTALHLAVESIRRGECSMALVGGAFLQVSPMLLSHMAAIGAVSENGISYSFDSRANGYGRGEGAGCLVLRRTEDAVQAGDSVRAIIRNTGVNHCGRSQGITVPSQVAQTELIRSVYASAGLDPSETAFVEAHGTGTLKGDPIEARSIASAFDTSSLAAENPLMIGSVKSNFGHLEAASGILAVLKSIAMLERETILPNANFEHPNPELDMEVFRLKVPTTCTPWPPGKAKRISINNFGFGGSNAHAILDAYDLNSTANGINGNVSETNGHMSQTNGSFTPPPSERKDSKTPSINDPSGELDGRSPKVNGQVNGLATKVRGDILKDVQTTRLYIVSGKSEAALERNALALGDYVNGKVIDDESHFLRSLSTTLTNRRSRFRHTYAVAAASCQQLVEKLSSPPPANRKSNANPLTFVFTGQGAQWARNGMGLMDNEHYSVAMHEADRYLQSLGAPWSLIGKYFDEIAKPEEKSRIGEAAISQPATTALQLALVVLLEKCGVRPMQVCGHSSGEIAAAYAAEIIDFHTAMAAAYYRGLAAARLESSTSKLAAGAMMAVGADVAIIRPLLDSLTSGIATIACYNSPQSLTISGDASAIYELKDQLDEMGVFARLLRVRTAYHSDHMSSVVDAYMHDLILVFESARKTQPVATFYSSVTASTVAPSLVASPTYWAMNLVCPVQFDQMLQSLLGCGTGDETDQVPPVLVELGPHSALRGPVREIVAQASPTRKGPPPQYVSSLQRKSKARDDVLELFASLINFGQPVQVNSIDAVDAKKATELLHDLPSYKFDLEKSYKHKSRIQTAASQGGSKWGPILGHRVSNALGDEIQFRNVFALDDIPWLADHKVNGSIIFPMAGYISAIVEALHCSVPGSKRSSQSFSLREVVIHKAFLVSDEEDNEMFTTLRPSRADSRSMGTSQWYNFEVMSWTERGGFVEHCQGLAKLTQTEDSENEVDSEGPKMQSQQMRELQQRVRAACSRNVTPKELYESAALHGLQYGPSFQGITELVTGASEAYGKLKTIDTSALMPAGFESPLVVHPAWVDAALHVGLCILSGNTGDPKQIRTHVPTFVAELSVQIPANYDSSRETEVYVHSKNASATASSSSANITTFYPGVDTPMLEICGIRMFQTSEAKGTEASEVEIINPSTVDWIPHPGFVSSLHKAAALVGGVEEERACRQEVERFSFYSMLNALAETSQPPQASHLRKFYDWAQRVTNPASDNNSDPRWTQWLSCSLEEREAFQKTFPGRWPDLALWSRAGNALGEIMREKTDALQVLMEDGMLFNIYTEASIFTRSFGQLAEMVDILSRRNPWLRILEVGAGTGGCTSRVLERIGSRFESYHYTDLSTGFFEAARTKFQSTAARMKFNRLDICADPLEQGFQPGYYDLVIAADVIHATPSIKDSLANVRTLLKPHGDLAMVELSRVTPGMLPFATLPGWWYRGDDDGAYIPEEEWQDFLTETGFDGIDASVRDMPGDRDHLHSVIWSKTRDERLISPRTVTVLDDWKALMHESLTSHLSRTHGVKDAVCKTMDTCDVHEGPYIFLHELSRPVLAAPDAGELAALQKLLASATEVLWVVKRDTFDDAKQMLYDFVFGFARSLRRENAGLKFVILQIDDGDIEASASHIASVFQHCFVTGHDAEDEFRVKDGILHFSRLVPHQPMHDAIQQKAGHVKTEERPFFVEGKPLCLDMTHTGSMDGMKFRPPPWTLTRPPLGSNEVIMEIKATGLNFKDVLIALGSLPWQGLGRECCGVVTEVGPEASSRFQVGDTVLHWGSNLFASHARCQADMVVKAPAHLSFAEAAAVPVIYSTAYESLVNVARLQPGEKVLIHAAAGGVGQAAIMLATWIGAEIFCTVGTLTKKALLISKYHIAEDHIYSSRSTTFADSLLLATKGEGVDVVLNSLSDEMFQSTWKCLSFFGRFIDIGKKHFVQNAQLELNPFDKSITYASVDLSLLMEHRPAYVRKQMADVVELFNQRVLTPPTSVNETPVAEVQSAFRAMQSGKVIGKSVIVNDASSVVTAEAPLKVEAQIRDDASYLITGGTGGLGRDLTRRLIERGARHVVLASRSGGDRSPDSPLNELLDWATKRNARVLPLACDVGAAADLKNLLHTMEMEKLPPVAGIIHGAMVLKTNTRIQDSLFENVTLEDWSAVIGPKLAGALNLHEACPNLDFFLSLSSVVAITGNVGQSSYSGSNASIDAFSHYRRRLGLHAASVNLPAIEDVGYVADAMAAGGNKTLEDIYAAAITPSQLWSVLEAAIAMEPSRAGHGTSGHVVAGLGTRSEKSNMYNGSGALLNLLFRETEARNLANAGASGSQNDNRTSLKQALAGVDLASETAKSVLFAGIAEKVSGILMVPLEDVKPEVSLDDLGLDSLIAVELRNWLVRECSIAISVIDISNSASVQDLADKVAARMAR